MQNAPVTRGQKLAALRVGARNKQLQQENQSKFKKVAILSVDESGSNSESEYEESPWQYTNKSAAVYETSPGEYESSPAEQTEYDEE